MSDQNKNGTAAEKPETAEQAETPKLKIVENRASRRGKKPKGTKENLALKRLQMEAQVRDLTLQNGALAERLGQMAEHLANVVNNQNALHEGLRNASGAVNRTERFLFSLIRVVLERTDIEYDDLQSAMVELAEANDLEVYWGAKDPPTEEELAQMELDRSVAAKFAEGWEPSGEDEDDAAALGIPLDKWVAWKDFQAEMAAREEAEHAAESEEVAALQADQAEVTE
jgi:hypothetical protein